MSIDTLVSTTTDAISAALTGNLGKVLAIVASLIALGLVIRWARRHIK